MLNMISSEFYRLRKSNIFWLLPLILAGIAVLLGVVLGTLPDGEMGMGGMGTMRPDNASGMLAFALPLNISNILWLLIGFTIVFISSDFSAGIIRNSLSVGVSKVEYYISKFVMVLIMCAVYSVVVIAVTTLTYTMFEPWGTGINIGDFLASVGLAYLILVAQAILFMAIALITRSVGASIGIILGYVILDSIIGSAVGMFELSTVVRTLANIFPSPAGFYLFELSHGTADLGDIMLVVMVALGTIVISSLLAIMSLTKKDI